MDLYAAKLMAGIFWKRTTPIWLSLIWPYALFGTPPPPPPPLGLIASLGTASPLQRSLLQASLDAGLSLFF